MIPVNWESCASKTLDVLEQADLVVLVIDPLLGITEFDLEIKKEIENRKIPLIGLSTKRIWLISIPAFWMNTWGFP